MRVIATTITIQIKITHNMIQKLFMIFTHFDLNSSSFRTYSKQIVPGQSTLTGLVNTGTLIHLKNIDFNLVSSFRLFIIYFDSQKNVISYKLAQEHIFAWVKLPHDRNTAPWPSCRPALGKQLQCDWDAWMLVFLLVHVCLLCFRKAVGDGYRILSVEILNSESICLATDFQAIR